MKFIGEFQDGKKHGQGKYTYRYIPIISSKKLLTTLITKATMMFISALMWVYKVNLKNVRL